MIGGKPMSHLSDSATAVPPESLQHWLQEYARRRSSGDGRSQGDLPLPALKEKIARAHGPLVESVARKFLGTGEPLEDLAQEGYLAFSPRWSTTTPPRESASQPMRLTL